MKGLKMCSSVHWSIITRVYIQPGHHVVIIFLILAKKELSTKLSTNVISLID